MVRAGLEPPAGAKNRDKYSLLLSYIVGEWGRGGYCDVKIFSWSQKTVINRQFCSRVLNGYSVSGYSQPAVEEVSGLNLNQNSAEDLSLI